MNATGLLVFCFVLFFNLSNAKYLCIEFRSQLCQKLDLARIGDLPRLKWKELSDFRGLCVMLVGLIDYGLQAK